MKKFAEGRVSSEDFWRAFKTNIIIREILIKDKKRPSYSYILYYAPERMLDIFDSTKLEDRAGLYDIVKAYFLRNKIKCNFYNEEANNWDFLVERQPEWIYVRD